MYIYLYFTYVLICTKFAIIYIYKFEFKQSKQYNQECM